MQLILHVPKVHYSDLPTDKFTEYVYDGEGSLLTVMRKHDGMETVISFENDLVALLNGATYTAPESVAVSTM